MQRLNRPVTPWIKQAYLPHTQSMCRGIAQFENEGTGELRGIPAPRGQLTLKRKKLGRAEEAHDQLPNLPIRKRTPPSQSSLTLAPVGVWGKRKREARRQQYGSPSTGRNCWESGEASSLLPSLALNPMCLSANLWLIQDSPLEDTRRQAPTSMRPSMGFKKRNHPLLPSFLPVDWEGMAGSDYCSLSQSP